MAWLMAWVTSGSSNGATVSLTSSTRTGSTSNVSTGNPALSTASTCDAGRLTMSNCPVCSPAVATAGSGVGLSTNPSR